MKSFSERLNEKSAAATAGIEQEVAAENRIAARARDLAEKIRDHINGKAIKAEISVTSSEVHIRRGNGQVLFVRVHEDSSGKYHYATAPGVLVRPSALGEALEQPVHDDDGVIDAINEWLGTGVQTA